MPETPRPSQGLKAWLAHAFAIEKPEEIDPTPPQREVVDRVCREVVRRHLTTPALAFMHMSQPLNVVAASMLHFLHPILSVIVDTTDYNHFSAFLEHRGSIDYLCRRLEHFENEIQAVRKENGTADER
jgi:hypothetical protein